MCALIALIGRPNVGKSTLFNRLVGKHIALVDDMPGVTRDRHYSPIEIDGREGTLIDTGGFDPTDYDPLVNQIRYQAMEALNEADLNILVLDGKNGLSPHDLDLANLVRRSNRPYLVAVNKIDDHSKELLLSEFHSLGLDNIFPVSASHGYGLSVFKNAIWDFLPENVEIKINDNTPKIAVIGRPNAGKSTLINYLAGQERQVTDDRPGTTRDSVDISIEHKGRPYVFVDTAGVRRRGRIDEKLEKLSVMKALKSLDKADIAILVIESLNGLAEQDAHIAGYALEKGRPIIIMANKWDLVKNKNETMALLKRTKDLKLGFLDEVPIVTASAKTGLRVDQLFPLMDEILKQYNFRASTSEVNQVLSNAIKSHTPPQVGRVRLKFFYGTQASAKPPVFVLFANRPQSVHFSYRRFLVNKFKEAFGLNLVPVKLFIKPRNPERIDNLRKIKFSGKTQLNKARRG